MKRMVLKAATVFIAAACVACIQSMQSSFYSNFSLQRLVAENKAHTGLECEPGGGGGGGGMTTWAGGFGFGAREFHSHKGDSFSCMLKSDAVEPFDEVRLIAALRQEVEKAINRSRAKITGSGSPDSSSFFFGYALDQVEGRVEISGKRITGGYYSLTADLDEGSKKVK